MSRDRQDIGTLVAHVIPDGGFGVYSDSWKGIQRIAVELYRKTDEEVRIRIRDMVKSVYKRAEVYVYEVSR